MELFEPTLHRASWVPFVRAMLVLLGPAGRLARSGRL
jgi:hypothetical protein